MDPTFAPVVHGHVNAIVVQPDGRIVAAGSFRQVNEDIRDNIVRINAEGVVDPDFRPWVDFEIFDLALQVFATNDWRLVMGGLFSGVNFEDANSIARLLTNGSKDPDFNAGLAVNGFRERVLAVEALPDGRIYVAGDFTQFNGQPKNHLVRLRADGSLDASFETWLGPNDFVADVTATASGKVLIAGEFSFINGIPRNRLAGLLEDGSVDIFFNPMFTDDRLIFELHSMALGAEDSVYIAGYIGGFGESFLPSVVWLDANGFYQNTFQPPMIGTSAGGDLKIETLALSNSGELLVGGRFGSIGSLSRHSLAKVNPAGVVTSDFVADVRDFGFIRSIMVQADGRLVIVGAFSRVNGERRLTVARLHDNGTLDNSFDPGEGVLGSIWTAALQPDGKVLIGGLFSQINGQSRDNLARLNADGSVDADFTPDFNWVVRTLVVPDEDQILVGGEFEYVNGQLAPGIARLLPDGSLDKTFNAQTNSYRSVFTIAVQDDRKILVGGNFDDSFMPRRRYLARLTKEGNLDESFDPNTELDSIVTTLAIDRKERILVGGWFHSIDGYEPIGVARLLGTGALDLSFNPAGILYSEPLFLTELSDGRIFMGGDVLLDSDNTRLGMIRFWEDCRLDESFGRLSQYSLIIGAIGAANGWQGHSILQIV